MANDKLKLALQDSALTEYLNISNDNAEWTPSDNFERKMEGIINKRKWRPISSRHILVAAAVVILVTILAVFSIAAVKDNILQFIVSDRGNVAQIEYDKPIYDSVGGLIGEGDTIVMDTFDEIYTLDLGDEYNETDHKVSDMFITTAWENGEGNIIILTQGIGNELRKIDTKGLARQDAEIDGVAYMIFSSDEYSLILWNTDKYSFSLEYYGNMKYDDIIKQYEPILR